MQVLLQLVGILVVLAALGDIFLTVLHPRAESNLLSIPVAQGVWWLFLSASRGLSKRRDRFLSYGGPIIIITIIAMWVLLLLVGWALIVWPALGSDIQLKDGETPTDFATAIYYAGFSLATLGTGDLLPQNSLYRLLIILKSILGFSVFTLALSYVLSIYSTLTQRNIFALSLHHGTANTGDSPEFLARLAANNNVTTLQQDISDVAQKMMSLLEFNNSYPVLLYFRYRQNYYTLPHLIYLTMDTATLIKTALDEEEYRAITASLGTAQLWFGGLHLLDELNQTFLPKVRIKQEENESVWRKHYYQALKRLQAEGIKTVADPEAGADSYISLRYQWSSKLARIIEYMAYDPNHIFPKNNPNNN